MVVQMLGDRAWVERGEAKVVGSWTRDGISTGHGVHSGRWVRAGIGSATPAGEERRSYVQVPSCVRIDTRVLEGALTVRRACTTAA